MVSRRRLVLPRSKGRGSARSIGVLVAGLLVATGQQAAFAVESGTPESTADYLVTFAAGTTQSQRESILEAAGAAVQSSVPPLRLYAATLTDTAAADLGQSASVSGVERDRVRQVQLSPNDPAFDDQWALGNIGWDSAYGSVVPSGTATVALLDTGVNSTEDLEGNLVAGASMLADVAGTDDPNGHGTAMASIIAAGVDNGTGIAGVAYHGVSVMPVKVLGSDGTGQDSAIVEGVVYAADHGADVILMSFSNPGASSALQAAVDYAWSKGAVLVAATGNDASTTASYPAAAAKVVGVSATTRDDTLWAGSNSGADAFLGAPGVDIASGSGPVTGTSASAAIVAGVAALVRANDPGAGPGVVVGRLARNADPAGSVSDTGNGRVNLARALSDDSTTPIVPQGVAGEGGPIVGPYVAAGSGQVSGTVRSSAPGTPVISGATVSCIAGCNQPDTTTTLTNGTYSFSVNYQGNSASVTLRATAPGFASQDRVANVSNSGPVSNFNFSLAPANSAPTATVSLTPVSPTTNQTVTATATKADADGNTVTLTYVWKVNGVTVKTTAASGASTDTLDLSVAGNGNRSDTVRVEVTPNDGTVNGATVNDSVVVANTAPSTSVPTFGSASPQTNDTLQASTITSDGDGDQVKVDWAWKITRGGNTCTIATPSSALAAPGTRTVTLDLSTSYPATSCTGANPGSINPSKADIVAVEATPTDAPGSAGVTRSNTVMIADSAPVVALSSTNDLVVDEGSTHTYSYTISDPDGDVITPVNTQCGTGASKVAGSDTNTSTTGSFQCKFLDGPNTPTQVLVRVKDSSEALSNIDSQLVTVNNVRPTIVLTGPASADEGQTKTYSYTVTDPGVDTHSIDWDCGFYGSDVVASGLYDANTGQGSFTCFFPDGPRTTNVTATVTDSDGAADTDNQQVIVTVSNVPPTVTLVAGNDLSVNEGTQHTYAFTVSDPGDDTFSLLDTDCGANGTQVGSDTFDTTTGAGSFLCRFPDGDASSTVSVQVADDFGASDTDTQTVAVSNVAPMVSLAAGNDLAVSEGTQHTYAFTVTDPGADGFSVVTVGCGANGTQIGAAATTSTGGSFVCRFPDGDASSTVSVQVKDSDDALSNTDTQTVAVSNVAPTVTLAIANDLSVNEGSQHTYAFTVTEPGQDTFSVESVSCGANGSHVGTTTTTATGGSFDCKFPDGPASSTVSVQVKDSDDALSNTDTQTVGVNNVKPSIALGGPATADEGDTKTYSYTVTDPGQDTHTITTGCGVNGAKVPASDEYDGTSGQGSFQCFFADGPAITNVTATVTDSDGSADTDNQQVVVTVNNVPPTVTLLSGNNLSVNEGSQHTYAFTVTDSGDDTFSVLAVNCGANGSQVGTTATTATGGSFACSFPDGDASSTVSVQVKDSDDALSNTDTQTVAVSNVAPTVTLAAGNDLSVDEGTQHTYAFAVTDPGTDGFSVVATSCGADGSQVGTTATTATGGSFECSFPDGDSSSTVSVQVKDSDDALSNTDTQTVTISNVAPTVALAAGNDVSVNEGTQQTYAFTVTDPGDDTISVVSVSCGANGTQAGTTTATAAGGSFDCSFPDGDASSTVSVRVKDSDDALSNTDTQTVTVNNVAPTVSLAESNDMTVSEGSQHTYAFTVTDPGQDTFTLASVSCGANGTQVGSATTTATVGSFVCRFPDGDVSSTVSVQVKDSDDALSNTDSQTVAVSNVAPTVTLATGNDVSVNEGSQHTYAFTVTDPGSDDFSVVGASCGADGSQVGTTATTATGGSFVCSFPDGDGSSTVSVQVKDSDDALSNTDSQTVAISNVAPTVRLSASNDVSVNEGSQHTDAFTVTDPGDDSFSVVSVSCGANGSQAGTTATTATGGSFVCSFPDGDASSTVSVQVKDSDDALSNTDTQTVTVSNVAPTVTLSAANDLLFNEGTNHTYAFSVTDPGQDTFAVLSVSCGLHGMQVGGTTTTASGGSFVCSFPDGPADSTVSVKVKDSDDAPSNTDTQIVSVVNVPPTVTLTGALSVDEGSQQTYSFTVTDPGLDTFVLDDTSCGTGGTQVGSDTFASTTGAGSFVCRFPDGPASPTVSVTVKDSDGGADSDTVAVNVKNVDPVVNTVNMSNVDPVTGKATLTATFADPGADTFAGSGFTTTNGATSPVPGPAVVTAPTMTAQVQLPRGCFTYTVTATVVDDDGGTGSKSVSSGGTDIYQVGFKDPIRDNERNIAKYGNVVPVKVLLSSACSGAAITTVALHLTIVEGNITDDAIDDSPNMVAESVSNADTGTQMRTSGGMYIYNLSTKSLKAGSDYTLRVRSGSSTGSVILKALFQPKK